MFTRVCEWWSNVNKCGFAIGAETTDGQLYDTQDVLDGWSAVRAETLDLGDRLADLNNEQWDSPSLCPAWRIRDVMAHLTAGAEGAFGIRAVFGGLLRHGFDYNRWIAVDGQRRGRQEPTVILQAFRTTAEYAAPSAGKPITALTHVLVHGQDICRPLGIQRDLDEAHLVPVANFVASSFIFRAKNRIAGLKLTATDADWSYGDGPEVRGQAEALVMMMAGRSIALEDLSGDGINALRQAVDK
jgi:uncharacterized protein (TIGR03083 family)